MRVAGAEHSAHQAVLVNPLSPNEQLRAARPLGRHQVEGEHGVAELLNRDARVRPETGPDGYRLTERVSILFIDIINLATPTCSLPLLRGIETANSLSFDTSFLYIYEPVFPFIAF